MKKIVKFEFEGKLFTVEVERSGNTLVIQKDGENYTVILKSDDVVVPQQSIESNSKDVIVQKEPVQATLVTSHSTNTGDIVAPMTGTIREIPLNIGDEVMEGQIVFVMEAMKMDIEVPTVVKGTIQGIKVSVGDSVTEGQLLAEIN